MAGRLAIAGVSKLEILFAAQSGQEFRARRADLDGMTRAPLSEAEVERAIEVQGLLLEAGAHRSAGTADLLTAACAEAHGLVVLHYDKDFDLIASVTGQPTEWLAPAGSLD